MDSQNAAKTSIVARLFSWRTVRRVLVALACVVTAIALFYTEEDWRGKRAWDKCQRELEANGVALDWSAFVPPPVPDDQNFFKAPGINEADWVGRGTSELSRLIEKARGEELDINGLTVAEITVVPLGTANALRLGDADATAQARKLVASALGSTSLGSRGTIFFSPPLDQIQPAKLAVAADGTPTTTDLTALFPKALRAFQYGTNQTRVRIESTGDKTFRATVARSDYAGDFLKRTDTLEPTFDVIREALKRPDARMDGNYEQPYLLPIPRFVTLRTLAQTLADRATCHLLKHNPAAALSDLTLLHDICLVTESKPAGQPMTLVAAMINVAITGLYADTVAEGVSSHAWNDAQLTALQDEMAHTDLMPFMVTSFQNERAYTVTTFEKSRPDDLFNAVRTVNGGADTLWARLHDPLYCFTQYAPRGWLYQNLVFDFGLTPLAEIGDAAAGRVSVEKAARAKREVDEAFTKKSPYTYLVSFYRPNGTRAWQSLGRSQSEVNEGAVACALERYRLAHGNYPDTLDALVPQFIPKLPHDIIGAQPLHYRLQPDGLFLLYSVGWNEKDDGGQSVTDNNGGQSLDQGDWVWPNQPQDE